MEGVKEIRINLELYHKEYNALIKYIGEAPKITGKGSESKTYNIYTLEGKCAGNPPKYTGLLIVSEVMEGHPEDAKEVAKSLKGLLEMIYKTEK